MPVSRYWGTLRQPKMQRAAKDLGACQRRAGVRNQVAQGRIDAAVKFAPRIRRLGLTVPESLTIARSLMLGGGLYGAEVDPLTVAQLQKLLAGMGHAIWGRKDSRNLSAALLLLRQGVGDPYVARAIRIGRHWAKQVYTGRWDEAGGPAYWETIQGPPPSFTRTCAYDEGAIAAMGIYQHGRYCLDGGRGDGTRGRSPRPYRRDSVCSPKCAMGGPRQTKVEFCRSTNRTR